MTSVRRNTRILLATALLVAACSGSRVHAGDETKLRGSDVVRNDNFARAVSVSGGRPHTLGTECQAIDDCPDACAS
jgi:hypothetical protein